MLKKGLELIPGSLVIRYITDKDIEIIKNYCFVDYP